MAKLGELGKIITGNTPKTSDAQNYESNDICFVKPSDFTDNEITEIHQSEFYISAYAKDRARVLPTDSILVTCIGIIGKVAINKVPCAFNQQINAIVPEKKVCDPRYIAYAIQNLQPKMQSTANAAVVPILNKTQFSNLEVPLLPVGEQKQIACNLNKIDKLIFLRKQQLDKLDELAKARFVEMFGDPVKNTMDWEIKPLSELGELNRGVSKARPRNSPELLGGPYPLIQTGEVANAKTYITSFNSTYSEKGFAQSKMWPKGTLCITIAANIAQTSILTFDACFPDSVVGFISRNMTNELFIHYWFSFFQKILDEQAPQVAQKNINLKILSELNVIVPPLSLQNRFAAFVERVDKQKQTVQQSLEKLELMKKALMQEYFG
mgnify:FL=1